MTLRNDGGCRLTMLASILAGLMNLLPLGASAWGGVDLLRANASAQVPVRSPVFVNLGGLRPAELGSPVRETRARGASVGAGFSAARAPSLYSNTTGRRVWIVNNYLIGPGMYLSGANLSHSNLIGTDLSGTTLVRTDLRYAHLHYAKLRGAVLRSVDLSNANLYGADLTGADLSGATLNRVVSGGITGTPKRLPAGWQIVNGYLFGPGADLSDANLSNASIRHADLRGANLSGANLANTILHKGARLSGVISGRISGTPQYLPAGWRLANGYLVGPGANLYRANLAGQDLRFANLHGAQLSQARLGGSDLAHANLTRANLIGSNLVKANVHGASLSYANLYAIVSSKVVGTPKSLPPGWQLRGGRFIRTW